MTCVTGMSTFAARPARMGRLMSPESCQRLVPIFIAAGAMWCGDVVLGGDGALWHIAEVDESGTGSRSGDVQTYESRPDPDATIGGTRFRH